MVTKEELYSKFGPLLIEALTILTLDEVNTLRENAGLPLRTKQQLMNKLDTVLECLHKYGWMSEDTS